MLPYTTYLIDLDGVIYRGNELLPGAKEFVVWLEAHHKKFLFLTNNSFASETEVMAIRGGAHFIAINRDALLPVAGGFLPGCGTMVAAIEAGCAVKPEVIGKPEPALLQEAMRTLKSQPDQTVMIGDGLDVDIRGG